MRHFYNSSEIKNTSTTFSEVSHIRVHVMIFIYVIDIDINIYILLYNYFYLIHFKITPKANYFR